MKFTELRILVDKIIELQVEIEKIKKENNKNSAEKRSFASSISGTTKNEKLDQIGFLINSKQKEIRKIDNILSKELGDWHKFFWVDIDELNILLNEYLKSQNMNGYFVLSVERQDNQNHITGEMRASDFLKIKYITDKEFIYTIKLLDSKYDFPDIKNLIMKALNRNQLKTNNIKLSPEILSDSAWQEFETAMYPLLIRKIYWEAVKRSIEKLTSKKQELLTRTVNENVSRVEKLNEEIRSLNKNSLSCISERVKIFGNSGLNINE